MNHFIVSYSPNLALVDLALTVAFGGFYSTAEQHVNLGSCSTFVHGIGSPFLHLNQGFLAITNFVAEQSHGC